MQCVIEATAYLTQSYKLSCNKKPFKGVKQKKILSMMNVILFTNNSYLSRFFKIQLNCILTTLVIIVISNYNVTVSLCN